MEPVEFLDSVSGYVRNGSQSSADRPIKLAKIDPAYNPFGSPYPNSIPPARVTFEGETTLSGKAYPIAPGYIPDPDSRVVMVPIGTTYLISGGATQYAAQGFYANSSRSGVDFGGGSYFDTNAGLVVTTDAYIEGSQTVYGNLNYGPRDALLPELRWGQTLMSTASNVGSITAAITFSPAFPVGTTVVVPAPNISSTASNTAGLIARAYNVSVTGMTLLILQADAARSPQIPAGFSASIHWIVVAQPPAGT